MRCSFQWINPVFTSIEPAIPLLNTLSSTQSISLHAADFQNAKIISQVDRKFIFITLPLPNGTLTAMIDQHAADERYRLETIIQNLQTTAIKIQPPIEISFPSEKNIQVLKERKSKLQQWGIELAILGDLVRISSIPGILEDIDATRWKTILLQYVTEDGLDCPSGMMNIFCSKACRSVHPS